MAETLFDELKRYVGFGPEDEAALRALHPIAKPHFVQMADQFYRRILEHEGARIALEGGESKVGRLKVTLVQWMDKLLTGPWDEAYFDLRCRIGRVHVRINLPQHYMFGAMNVVRAQLNEIIDEALLRDPAALGVTRRAVGRILDLELAIMLHTYREDLMLQQGRNERLATFGQLVGSIGHELRNPLGVIETSLFILKGRQSGDERTQKHLDRIGEQLGVANGIITNLLDMIRDRPLTMQRQELAPIVASAIESIRRPEGVEVSVEGVGGLPLVEGDPVQLRQVVVNLVENAVQASGPTGQVLIRGRTASGMVELEVEDRGPGVEETTRRRLFEPLVTTKEKGLGLGLALVKRIVERHGGSIRYEAAEPHGARFIVRLPAAR